MSINNDQDLQKKLIKDYWLEKLSATAAYSKVATVPTPPGTTGNFACAHSLPLTSSAVTLIKSMSKNNPVTEFIITLSIWEILLYKYFNTSNVLIASPGLCENREVETGNTLLFYRLEIGPGDSLKEILPKNRAEVLESFSHAGYSFSELKAALMKYFPESESRFRFGIHHHRTHGKAGEFENTALQLVLETGEEVEPRVEIKYDKHHYEDAFVRQLAVHYLRLLENTRNNLDKQVMDMEILSPEEKRHLIEDFNEFAPGSLPLKTIPGIFQEQAERFPGRVAQQCRDLQITYRVLAEISGQLAQDLNTAGVQPGTLVGIKLERSAAMIAGILGILKSGGAYLPIDPDYPRERIDFMLKDSGVKRVVTAHNIEKVIDGTYLTYRTHMSYNAKKNPTAGSLPSATSPAYIIYTSGSTGKPKGVMVEHRNVVSLLFNEKFPFKFSEEETWTLFHSICFDFSIWELFGALLYGGRSVVVPLETARTPRLFAELLQKNRVTVLNQVPTMFYNLAPELLESKRSGQGTLYLRYIIFGGEALNPGRLSAWQQEYPGVKLVNMYGITETTVHVTYKEIGREDIETGNSPIGKPLPAWSSYILDDRLKVVPPGIPGEILVGGEGVARGYLNRVELTHDKFIKVPGICDSRLYRSGDSGKWCFDRSIDYLGRIDEQVKIRGFRIECGEIEKCLLELETVKDVTVVVGEDNDNHRYLAAYIVDTGEEDAGDTRYRNHLEHRLPEYMMPAYFVPVEKFPRTPSGKVDKKALPPPGYRRPGGGLYEAPATEVEKGLAAIWEEVLGVERIGVHENFFNLGGDSIKGIHVVNKIQQWLREIMHVSVIFEAPTIKELAVKLESYRKVRSSVVDEAKVEKFLRVLPPLPPFPVQLPKNPPAVFILSPPRSGSTLLRVILAGHPQLFAPPELELLSFNTLRDRRAELSGRYAYFAEGAVRAIMELKGCSADQAQSLMTGFENAELKVQEFYRQLQEWLGDHRRLVDKTPFYTLKPEVLERAEDYFDAPRYIHLLRGPQASIHSFEEAKLDQIFRYPHEFTVRELAELVWLVSNRNILHFLDRIPRERKFSIKFETLVLEPEASARRICEFLGIEFSPGMLQVYGDKRGKMIDGIHPESKMLGDIKFLQHKTIDHNVVSRWETKNEGARPGPITLELASRLGYLDNNDSKEKKKYDGIVPVPGRSHYRLSHAQKRMWLLEQLDKHRSAYNISGVYQVEGRIDTDVLGRAFAALIKRHESLRTVFCLEEGEPVQKIKDFEELEFKLEILDMRHEKQWLTHARSLINGKVTEYVDLSKVPLLRAGLIHAGEGEYVLFFVLPHIIADGWSIGLLLNELVAFYSAFEAGKPEPLTPLRIHYKDFCEWQRSIITEELLKEQEQYWLGYFKDEIPVLNLPTDYPRPAFRSFNGGTVNVQLPDGEIGRLKALSEEENVTLFMVLFTAASIFLSVLTGQEDMVIGTPIAGRNHEDLRQVVGMFVNTLAMRVQPAGHKTLRDFLTENRQHVLRAFENQDYPFETLVEQVVVDRDASRNPLFDMIFSLQGTFMNAGEIPGLQGTGLNINPFRYETGISKFDMGLYGAEEAGRLTFSVEYCADLFKRETVERYTRYFKRIIAAMTGDLAERISGIEVISPEEKEQILFDFNETAVEYPREKTIPQLFAEQVEHKPDHIALVGSKAEEKKRRDSPVQLTYHELNEQANRLAGLLREKSVQPDTTVGIMIERSLEMIIGILGILKVGGVYMPIDPGYPQERIAFLLKDSNPIVLLTAIDTAEVINNLYKSPMSPGSSGSPGNLPAYIMYTSGSTGRPKGVMCTHRNVVRLVKNTNFVELSERTRILETGAPVFDATTFETWGSLLNGGMLCLVNNDIILEAAKLGQALRNHRINTLWLSSPLFNQLMQQDSGIFSPLENLVVGGDVLSPGVINEVRHRHRHLKVVNGYGPTENTTFSLCYTIEQDFEHTVPIGKPIANSTAYIVDRYNHFQPLGIPGELWVGGDGIATGYLNNPELTSQKFLLSLYRSHRSYRSYISTTLYRTGDLARWQPGGNIQFLGRIDQQVKIRGFRVEPGEIEKRLAKHKEIKEVIVTVVKKEDRGEDKLLCAYFTAAREFTTAELREYLGGELPGYMIPAFFVQLETIPLTVNGKVDRRALPVPGVGPVGKNDILPGDETEEKLAVIWSDLLSIEKILIGVEANFFQLGGHSLKAAMLTSLISKEFNVEFPLRDVFTGPTVREMAEIVKKLKRSFYDEIKPVEFRRHYPQSPAQKRIFFLEQLDNIGYSCHILNMLKVEGNIDAERFAETLKRLVERHEPLRTSFGVIQNETVQVVHETADFNMEYLVVPGTGEKADLEEITGNFLKPFDLSRPPLFRVGLYKLAEKRCLLLYDLHHIIGDGTSLEILVEEFMRLYAGEGLAPLPIQYKDFAVWQKEMALAGKMTKQENYWLDLFSGEIPRLNLPTDLPRPERMSFAGDSFRFNLEAGIATRFREIGQAVGSTLYMSLLAAYNVLFYKYTGQTDIIVGTGIMGRPHAALYKMIGMFINMLALRNFPSGEKTYLELLKEVGANTIKAFENQDVQFDEIVDRLKIGRDYSRNPLFDVELSLNNFQQARIDEKHRGDLQFDFCSHENKTTKFDLVLYANEVGNEIYFNFRYSTALFKRETIEKMARHFIEILEQVVENQNFRLDDIRLSHEVVMLKSHNLEEDQSDFDF